LRKIIISNSATNQGGGATKVDTEAALNPVNCRYAFVKKTERSVSRGPKIVKISFDAK